MVRDRGALARIVDDGRIENVYRLQIMNATERAQRYAVRGRRAARHRGRRCGERTQRPAQAEVGPAQERWVPVRVQLPYEAAQPLAGRSHAIGFRIERLAGDGEAARTVHEKSTFIVPR